MPADLCFRETADLAKRHAAVLEDARGIMQKSVALTPLEENGVLHALQVLIGNAIGKAKQTLKLAGEPVPTSAYDALQAMVRIGQLPDDSFPQWAAIIGLRNRIVHEYMNLDIKRVLELVNSREHAMVVDFLLTPPSLENT